MSVWRTITEFLVSPLRPFQGDEHTQSLQYEQQASQQAMAEDSRRRSEDRRRRFADDHLFANRKDEPRDA
jgi:hypothetical protein